MDYRKLNYDIWREIFSYLDLKSIFILERTDQFFQQALRSTRFWERKMEKEFPHCDKPKDKDYFFMRKLYWTLYCLNHDCNVCKLCFIDNICDDIPDCGDCDWLDFLD